MIVATLSLARADVPESVVLAAGYAQAFQATGKLAISITYTGAAQNEEIRAVRSISAYGGVLLIKMRDGSAQILDPARIVKMAAD